MAWDLPHLKVISYIRADIHVPRHMSKAFVLKENWQNIASVLCVDIELKEGRCSGFDLITVTFSKHKLLIYFLRPSQKGKSYEPRHEKTNILVSYQVQQKPGCTATEDG